MKSTGSMLIIFTGNGKGKTSAAIGQAIRAMGTGGRVFFIQFIKGDGYPSGEDGVLQAFEPRLHFEKGGLGFVGILGDKVPLKRHQAAARKTLKKARDAAVSGNYDLLILDELNMALDLKLVTLEEVLGFLEAVPSGVDVVLTGRHAHSEILARADLITNYEDIWHPYHAHVLSGKRTHAKRGIEF